MFVFFQLLVDLLPFLPLFYLVSRLNKFSKILYERDNIREKNISFKKIKDLLPKSIRQELEDEPSIENECVNELLKAYEKLLVAVGVYVIFWIVYFIGIVIRIVFVFNKHYDTLKPKEYGALIGSILMSFILFYCFFLTPVFETLKINRLSKLGYNVWKAFQYMLGTTVKWFKKINKYICELVISFLPMYIYISLIKKVLGLDYIKTPFWMALLILMIYQYILLKIVSIIIKRIISIIIKKTNKFRCLERYVKGEILYLILKNCTYLSMVFVYAVSVDMQKSGSPLAAAIGVLFLVDTFFLQENDIQDKMDKSDIY